MMPDCTDRSPAAGKIGDAVFAAQGIKVLQYPEFDMLQLFQSFLIIFTV